MIILDTRETKLIDLIKTTQYATQYEYKVEHLQIGDIIIRHNDKEIILERKCITDMIASIKDGRYKEQKLRLLAETHKTENVGVAYILEGSYDDTRLAQDKTLLTGSIISSIFRDKIPIIRTYSLQETLDIIFRLNERFTKNNTDFFTQQSDTIPCAAPYLTAIKKCKKDNITPAVWTQICYTNITGISNNIAIKISEHYPTIKKLLEAYSNCTTEDEKENLLANIILTDTGKQKRKIGTVISKRVYQFIGKD